MVIMFQKTAPLLKANTYWSIPFVPSLTSNYSTTITSILRPYQILKLQWSAYHFSRHRTPKEHQWKESHLRTRQLIPNTLPYTPSFCHLEFRYAMYVSCFHDLPRSSSRAVLGFLIAKTAIRIFVRHQVLREPIRQISSKDLSGLIHVVFITKALLVTQIVA